MKKKISLGQTFRNIFIIIFIAIVFFFVGKLWPSSGEPTRVTSDLLTSQIQDIHELATVEYGYTNMGKYENQTTFYGWKVPFTTKRFIISYDGKIKAGIDMSKVDINIQNQIIQIQLPQSQILSHEIDLESIEVFDETHNIFNPIHITDYNQFSIDQKNEMEKKVIEKGLLDQANDKAKETIKTFLTSSFDLDDYQIEFQVGDL